MWFGVGIIGLIIWIAIAFWPARVAGRKGHSFIGYFLLSLLLLSSRSSWRTWFKTAREPRTIDWPVTFTSWRVALA